MMRNATLSLLFLAFLISMPSRVMAAEAETVVADEVAVEQTDAPATEKVTPKLIPLEPKPGELLPGQQRPMLIVEPPKDFPPVKKTGGEKKNPFGRKVQTNDDPPPFLAQFVPASFSKLWMKFLRTQKVINKKIATTMRKAEGGATKSLFIAIAFSFLYGAIHVLGPGHGKVFLVSFFIGRHARWWEAPKMATVFAITHVISAEVMVLLVDQTTRHVFGRLPSEVMPIKVISYGLIVAIGTYMLISAIRGKFHETACMCETDGMHKKYSSHGLAIVMGMVPCAGVMLILLYALANDMLWLGMALSVAFAFGLAITLSALGIVVIVLRERLLGWLCEPDKQVVVARILQGIGASFIMLFGIALLFGNIG